MEVLTCSWLQWPLYCAHQLNCTLTTMYALKIYHMTLYSKSYYTNHSNNVAHHYDVPMCYLTKLLSKSLIQNITAMWALTSMCAVITWFCKVNDILHTFQKYGSQPLCKCWCGESLLFKVNVLFHTSQQYGRWPLCMHWCFIMSFFWINAFLHTLRQ